MSNFNGRYFYASFPEGTRNDHSFLERMEYPTESDRLSPYSDSQRTCDNCEHYTHCLMQDGDHWIIGESMPRGFQLREGWDANRYINYMKVHFAEKCGRFLSTNPNVRARQEYTDSIRRTEVENKQKKEKIKESGWDG